MTKRKITWWEEDLKEDDRKEDSLNENGLK